MSLFIANCGHPPVQHDALRVTGDIQDMMPVMEGFNVSFSCHSEFKLSGHISSTCMRNGEWKPDPREVECRHKGIIIMMFHALNLLPHSYNIILQYYYNKSKQIECFIY